MDKPQIKFDLIIIGGGVIGCAIARQLSRYKLKIALLEANDDVSTGASKANSGIVHGGYTAKAGTLKGELSIKGNRCFDDLEQELHFGFKRIGSYVLAFTEDDLKVLKQLQENGEKNGVKGLEILSSESVLQEESAINHDVLAALYCPETGIVSPYEYCIALAENAVQNGLELHLNEAVSSIIQESEGFSVGSAKGSYKAQYVINAAGVQSAEVADLLGARNFTILPRKGQYLVMRRGSGEIINKVVFQTPSDKGKGILVTPTIWNNLLIGPNAEDIHDMDDLATDVDTLRSIYQIALKSVNQLDPFKIIRSFSGIRPRSDRGDFIIEESPIKGFYNIAGIESPGLTASPAIALKVEQLLRDGGVNLVERSSFDPHRKKITSYHVLKHGYNIMHALSFDYGNPDRMVCRCEQVEETVIKEALSRGIPIRSIDAVKRRTRAGMGTCQGHYCRPRVEEYLKRECGLSSDEIIGPHNSPEITNATKDAILDARKTT